MGALVGMDIAGELAEVGARGGCQLLDVAVFDAQPNAQHAVVRGLGAVTLFEVGRSRICVNTGPTINNTV